MFSTWKSPTITVIPFYFRPVKANIYVWNEESSPAQEFRSGPCQHGQHGQASADVGPFTLEHLLQPHRSPRQTSSMHPGRLQPSADPCHPGKARESAEPPAEETDATARVCTKGSPGCVRSKFTRVAGYRLYSFLGHLYSSPVKLGNVNSLLITERGSFKKLGSSNACLQLPFSPSSDLEEIDWPH